MGEESRLTYAQAGVDIAAGNALVERIKPLAKSTDRRGTMAGLGGFGALFDLKAAGFQDPILVSATDGVGTKLKLAIEAGIYSGIGIDLVAMCVNDLICQGAEPLFFLDYFATSKLDLDQAQTIIEGIAAGCKQSGAALIGGETAEMPGLYAESDFDLAGFAVGAVERDQFLPRAIAPGDVLVGFASNGLHSNGFSLVRRIVAQSGLSLQEPAPFDDDKPLIDLLLAPTRLYVSAALAGMRAGGVHGLVHVTGGGIDENLPRILPAGLGAYINQDAWDVGKLFRWLAAEGGVESAEMRRTFNMGIGLIAAVSQKEAKSLQTLWSEMGEHVFEIGHVTDTPGLVFSGDLL